jgi:hypothetical protein
VSPTQRSLKRMRDLGYLVDVVERWIPGACIRKDLWGIADLLCLRGKEILAVQVTSGSNVSARVKKIADSENLPIIREAGVRLEVHGWRKLKAGWECRVVDCS